VGGGTVFPDKKVVVTQPTPGSYRAFSAICTHQSCTVNKVVDGTIDCPCHGSKFAITTGAPVHGPATRPLASRQVKVDGDTIVLA
jgi:Rieske Fe-S protein